MYSIGIHGPDYERSFALPSYKTLLNSNSPPIEAQNNKDGIAAGSDRSDFAPNGAQTLPKTWKEPEPVQISDCTKIPVEIMAKQITLIDWNIFKSIAIDEFVIYACDSKLKHVRASSVAKFTKQFNTICFWAISVILKFLSVKRRAEAISFFIKLAKKLHELNNIHSEFAILSALRSAPIYRLSKTWNYVPKRHRYQMEKLTELFLESDNHANLRQYLNTIKLPCIPYTGFYLTDLVYINNIKEASSPSCGKNKTGDDGDRTFTYLHHTSNGLHHASNHQASNVAYADSARQSQINNILRVLAEYQASDYSFIHHTPSIQVYLASQNYGDGLHKTIEDNYFKASQFLEPPPPPTSTTLTPIPITNDGFPDSAAASSKKRPSPVLTSFRSLCTSAQTTVSPSLPPIVITKAVSVLNHILEHRDRSSNGGGDADAKTADLHVPTTPTENNYAGIELLSDDDDDDEDGSNEPPEGRTRLVGGGGCLPTFLANAANGMLGSGSSASRGHRTKHNSPKISPSSPTTTPYSPRGNEQDAEDNNFFLSPASAHKRGHPLLPVGPGHRKAKSLGTPDDLDMASSESIKTPHDRISVSSSSESKPKGSGGYRTMGPISNLLHHLTSFQLRKNSTPKTGERSPTTNYVSFDSSLSRTPSMNGSKIILPSFTSATSYKLRHRDSFKDESPTDTYRISRTLAAHHDMNASYKDVRSLPNGHDTESNHNFITKFNGSHEPNHQGQVLYSQGGITRDGRSIGGDDLGYPNSRIISPGNGSTGSINHYKGARSPITKAKPSFLYTGNFYEQNSPRDKSSPPFENNDDQSYVRSYTKPEDLFTDGLMNTDKHKRHFTRLIVLSKANDNHHQQKSYTPPISKKLPPFSNTHRRENLVRRNADSKCNLLVLDTTPPVITPSPRDRVRTTKEERILSQM